MSGGNYLTALEIYRQNGDICAYLNITATAKTDVENLEDKLNALDIYKGSNKSFLNIYLPALSHQLIVGECSYNFTVKRFFSQWYIDNALIWYDEKGVIKPAIPYIIFPNIFAFLSIILNLSLIFVSIRKISMERMCNILILFEAFCQLFSVLPFVINMIALLANVVLVDYHICLYVHLLSTIASYSSFLTIYFISLERLLIIIYPTKIHKIRTSTIHRISFVVCMICILFGIIMALTKFNVITVLNLPYYKVILCNSGLYSDILYSIPSYIILIASVLNYLIIFSTIYWRFISKKLKEKKAGNNQTNQNNLNKPIPDPSLRILRSIFIISSIIIFGWIIGSAARNLITTMCINFATSIAGYFTDTKTSQIVYGHLSTILISIITCVNPISAGINSIILIISNSEYRNSYKTAFGIKQRTHINSIGPYFTNQHN